MSNKATTGKDSIIMGVVESIDDPTYSGRIKVRVKGFHDNIPTEQLPWCSFGGSIINSANGCGSISIARVGQQVRVQFKNDANTSMEWVAVNSLDADLINEIKGDYEGTHVLLYDSAVNVSIKYQHTTGLTIYYQGSFIQIAPDNTITLHYGEGATGTQIQLSDGRVDIQGSSEINLTTSGNINLEADNIILNAKSSTQIKGKAPAETAVNGVKLISALMDLAWAIDNKIPNTCGQTATKLNGYKEAILNQNIQYFK